MNKKEKKVDKISCTILTAFILMGSVHFNCRYNIVPLIDTFFHQVSAEQVLPDAPTPAPLVEAPVVATNYAGNPENTAEIVHKSVARNPFAVPMTVQPQQVTYTPVNSNNNSNNNNNYNTYPRTAGGSNAPVVEKAVPILRGVVQSGNKSMAIIEYAGTSQAYSVGQTVGSSTIEAISDKSISLDGNVIHIGGNP